MTAGGIRDEPLVIARHGALFIFLCLVLVWAPIPIGSNRGWSVAVLEAATLFLLAGLALSHAMRSFELPAITHCARLSLLFLTAWSLYPLVQTIPVSQGVANLVAAKSTSLYTELPFGTSNNSTYISLDRGATIAGFLYQISLVAALLSAMVLVDSRFRLKLILYFILAVGFAEALYGLAVYLGGDALGLWSPGHAQVTVSGTFVNQNHFACLMEMTIPVGLGLLLCEQRIWSRLDGCRSLGLSISDFVLSRRGVITFCLVVMTSALILTNSRGAIGALVVGMAVTAAIAAWKKGIHSSELRLVAVAGVIVVVAVAWLGSGQFVEKLHSAGLSSDRGDLREVSYRIIGDSPVVGTGVGTYRWVFPGYKDERFGSYFYEHAHNDYLEILSEQGVIGFFLLAAGVITILTSLVAAFARRRDALSNGTLFAVIAGSVSFMVHGFVDFNFQIPANAIYFFVLLGLGVVASSLSHARPSAEDPRDQ